MSSLVGSKINVSWAFIPTTLNLAVGSMLRIDIQTTPKVPFLALLLHLLHTIVSVGLKTQPTS